MHFNHYGGPGAELAADLVNTRTPKGVNGALAKHAPTVRPVDSAGAQALLSWGRRLRPVFTAELDTRVATVNELLTDAAALPYVSAHDGRAPHLHYASAEGDTVTRVRAFTAGGVAHLLCEEPDRLGACRAPWCDVVYVDTSRNGRRQYCSTRCANRIRVAEHRHRRSVGSNRVG